MALYLDKFLLVRAFLLLACTILVMLGTALPMAKMDDTKWYLFHLRAGLVVTPYGDIGCTKTTSEFRTAYAFAIMGCIVVGFTFFTVLGLILGALSESVRAVKIGTVISSITAFIFLLICFAIIAGFYFSQNCDLPDSPFNIGYDIGAGLAMIITTFCVLVVDFIIGIVGLCVGGPEVATPQQAKASTVSHLPTEEQPENKV